MRVLFDTSFLLPTLGIEVERTDGILRELSNLDECEIYYSDFSILECLWVAGSLERKGTFDQEIFRAGMESIFEGYTRAETNPEIILKSLELYGMGHRDIIDCILYSTAIYDNLKFVSLDEGLKRFVRDNNLRHVFY